MSLRKRNQWLAVAWTLAAAASAANAQTIIYVDDDASLAGDGTSWNSAFKYLHDALSAAASGDEIRVAAGIYKPDQDEAGNVTPSDREATFELINSVGVYGGYAGLVNPGQPDERNIEVYETTFSGDLAENDARVACSQNSPDCDSLGGICFHGFCTIHANNGENSYHVLFHPDTLNLDETAVLDGVTITAGNANGEWPHNSGAGMRNHGSSPTLANCTFKGNSGGAMTNRQCLSMLTNCEFSGNSGTTGGGIYNDFSSAPIVTNCAFSANWAHRGGGIRNNNSSPTVTNCTFSENLAIYGDGGAIYNDGTGSNPVLTNCILWGNDPNEISYTHDNTPIVSYSCIAGGWPGEGNISDAPLFVSGPRGYYYLSQLGAGQSVQSPCADAGSDSAANLSLDTLATRTDNVPDTGIVDMGYHHSVFLQPVPAVSEWGLVAMTLLFLTAGTLVYSRRSPTQT